MQELINWLNEQESYSHAQNSCVVTTFTEINKEREGTKEKLNKFAQKYGITSYEAESFYEGNFSRIDKKFKDIHPSVITKEDILPILEYLNG